MARNQATCHPERPLKAKGKCESCYSKTKSREWYSANRVQRLARVRERKYGINGPTIKAMLDSQNGLCKLCLTRPATDIDHDHVTGTIRGILCGTCNTALGKFKESATLLRKAAAYIETEGRL